MLKRTWKRLEPLREHFRREKWFYVFGAFVWALVWYGSMNLMSFIQGEQFSGFPVDVMPLIAGVPIIIVGWRAVAIGDKLEAALHDFDDGAAFTIPPGKPGVLTAFIADLRRSIVWWSRIISAVIVFISLAGVLTFARQSNSDSIHQFLAVLLVLGVPLIAFPIGTLLGQLLGFSRLNHVIRRHGITLAGFSTPQSRDAWRALAGIRTFAVIAPLIMCYWFAGWWIAWSLGIGSNYGFLWKTQFLMLWLVSIAILVFAGIIPAHNFKKMLEQTSGGAQGRAARQRQVSEAEDDLKQWQQSSNAGLRHQRQRIEELDEFISNLKDQEIENRFLDTKLLVALLAVNLVILVTPPILGFFTTPPQNPAFQGTKA